ncbi:MAG: DUF177 domain-containing protein [Candidatus Competibacteraceae bacterium]|nr:DUF177 domain-containing protein [Candidatus Competibacteraceae bacterium]
METPLLPAKIRPWRMAAEHGCLNGRLALAALPRLTALLGAAEGEVVVALSAGCDAQGVRFIQGRLCAEVEWTCQRCLGPLRLPLDVQVNLGLVSDEAAANRLPDEYDPLLVQENSDIAVADLVEDELLLALPQIPRHEDLRECAVHGYAQPDESTPDPKKRQPFAALATLLQDSQRSH